MARGYPTYSAAARKGEAGVSLVSKVVSDKLGWIFRRHHQEQDFGIDGQIEVVTEDGAVTGQAIAVQIKYGRSFFNEKTAWGYVYRGELKHFNYLANYPAIVLVIICHPTSKDCYWARFEPESAEMQERGWKLTLPFANRLHTSKQLLLSHLGPPVDQIARQRAYWELNKMIVEASTVLYVLDDQDVKTLDTSHPRQFFDRLRKTRELAAATQGKIELAFSGYDSDTRELFEIAEVRRYVAALDGALPDIFFFIRTDAPSYALKVFALCLCHAKWEAARSTPVKPAKVVMNNILLADFMERHWPALNELTDWIGMSTEENKRISFAIMRNLGVEPDDEDT